LLDDLKPQPTQLRGIDPGLAPGLRAFANRQVLRRAQEQEGSVGQRSAKLPRAAELMPQQVVPEKSATSSKTVIAGGLSVAAGAATVADQANQLSTTVTSVTQAVSSVQGLLKLGALGLSIVALAAAAYFTWRYIQKRRRGEVLST
jgi:hypothetical protein